MTEWWEAELDNSGWVFFQRGSTMPTLRDISRRLCLRRVESSRLVQFTKETARPNTLSSSHGLDAFPFHTDKVLSSQPPRYIMFFAPQPRLHKTLLFKPGTYFRELWDDAVFQVRLNGRLTYTTATFLSGSVRGIRYNADCMTPQNQAARDLARALLRCGVTEAIDWNVNRQAIVDNWRCLHGREQAAIGAFPITRIWGWTEIDLEKRKLPCKGETILEQSDLSHAR